MSSDIGAWINGLPDQIAAASHRIANVVQKTPLLFSDCLSELTGANVYLKCENLQTTGSFKLRGASNKYLSLAEGEREIVVTASTGNHGKAVAHVAKQFGTRCKIFVPTNSKPVKLDAIRRLGAEVVMVGEDCIEAEANARTYATNHDLIYISPYNDQDVIAGQGTIGLEISQQLDRIDTVLAAVGGGGMIGSLASAIHDTHPSCDFVACSPTNSCVMVKSLEAGELLNLPSDETLSDGTAGGVEPNSITFDLCRQLIQDYSLVSESEIANAWKQFVDSHSMLIEGAAAVPVASLLKDSDRYRSKTVVLVLCGANISFETMLKFNPYVSSV